MSAALYIYDTNRINISEVILDNAKSISINLGIKDFTNTTGQKNNLSFFTYTLEIPYEANIEVFKHAVDFNFTEWRDLIGIEVLAFLESNFLTFRGFVKITGYKREREKTILEGQFLGGVKNWVSRLPTNLRDIELGESTFDTATVTSIFQNDDPYDGTSNIWYSAKFYQKFLAVDQIQTLDMKPDIYWAAIVKELSRISKTPIQSQFFNTEYFKRHLFPYVGDGTLEYVAVIASLSGDLVINNVESLNFNFAPWVVTLDPLTRVFGINDGVFLPNGFESVGVRVEISFSVNATDTSKVIFLTDENLFVYDQSTLVDGQNEIILEGTFNNVSKALVIVDFPITIQSGSSIRFCFRTTPFLDTIIKHNSVIPEDLKTTDYISAISDPDNLVWFYDEMNDKLIAEPKWPTILPTGEFVPGFYHGIALSEDYTGIIDCAEEKGNFKINTSLKRNLVFAFQKDDNNKIIENDRQWAHEQRLSPKYPDGETIQRNELFAPIVNLALPEAYGGTNAPAIIPQFVNDKKAATDPEGEPNFDFKPVLLYKLGNLNYEWRLNSTTLSTGVPIAAQVLISNPALIPVGLPKNVNIGFGDHQGLPGIVSTFYRPDIEIYNFGARKTVKLALPLESLVSLESLFRMLKFLNLKTSGNAFHVLEQLTISINKDTVTEVKLITK